MNPRHKGVVLVTAAACVLGLTGTAAAAPSHPSGKPPAPVTGAPKWARESANALAQARRTGVSVPVKALTTPTSATAANPQGTFTLTQSVQPVRAWRHGTWQNLDPRLHRDTDRSLSPNVTTNGLKLSGGGAGPLATMTATGHTLALTWPAPLPAPTISGATATYPSVLKDVDLVVTVSPQGGFRDTLVVRSAAAATDPRLTELTMAARGDGLSVTADAAGNLKAAATAHGAPVFTADAPAMWDSAGHSSTTAPSSDAHVAPVRVTAGRSITLRPERGLLTSASTVFPVYIAPAWVPQSAGSTRQGWAQVDTLDKHAAQWMPAGLRSGHCGQGTCAPAYTARSYVRMDVPPQLQGARIDSSELNLTVASAPYASCTGAPTPGIQLWSTGAISPSTTWNHGPSWHQNIAEQAPPACAGQNVGFPITTFMRSHAEGATSLTFGIRAASETDENGWKGFNATTLTMSTTYDHAPGLPTDLATSPGGPCQTGSPSATLIGNDDVTFQAVVTDPDGGQLGTEFVVTDYDGGVVYDSGDAASALDSTSGGIARLDLRRTQIQGWHADGATAAHAYSWYIRTSDGELYSPTTGIGSAGSPCTFTYDPTFPSAPGVAVTTDASGSAGALGGQGTLTLAPCAGALATPPATCTGTAPGRYTYQLDSGAPQNVTATGGVQTVRFPLHHVGPATVTVVAFSAAGNPGDSASAGFIVKTPNPPYADGDVDGDGHADVLMVGPETDPGLWLARGDGAGGLAASTDIGAAGTGISVSGPAGWNGVQALHGDFTGNHVQDVLAYYPAGDSPGQSSLVYGNGDATPLDPVSGSQETLFSDQFADYTLNGNGDTPSRLVAAGNASLAGTGIADLVGISGDPANGYQLDLYTTCGDCSASHYGYTQTLAGPGDSPDGDGDWNDFSLVTAQPGGKTVLFALKNSTGELWESTNPSQDASTPIGTPASAGGTWTKIDVPWTSATVPSLVSGDVNAAGAVELWAQTGTTATPYTLTGTTLAH